MADIEPRRGPAVETGRKWIRRINDAIERLKLGERARKRAEVIALLDGEFGTRLASQNYADWNDGEPLFRELINARLPNIPSPNADIEAPDEGPCEKCGGSGQTLSLDMVVMPCEECLGKGIVRQNTDLKCEAYLKLMFAPWVSDVEGEIEKIMWDELSWGVAWAKTTWRETVQRARPQPDAPDADAQIERAAAEATEAGIEPTDTDNDILHVEQHNADIARLETDLPLSPLIAKLQEHVDQFHVPRLQEIVSSRPELERACTDAVLYDPFATKWSLCGWVAEAVTWRLKDLKAKPGVKNMDRRNLPLKEKRDEDPKPIDDPADSLDELVDVFEIHNRLTNEYLILPAVPGGDKENTFVFDENVKPVYEGQWPWPGDMLIPLVLRHNGSKELHGSSTLCLCKSALEELARVNRLIRRHAQKHSQYKQAYPRGTLDDKAKKDVQNPEKDLFEIPPSAMRATEFKPPPIPETLLQMRELLIGQILRRIVGVDDIASGAAHPHQITATEASGRIGYQESRVSRQRRKIGEFLDRIGINFLELFGFLGRDEDSIALAIDTPIGKKWVVFSPSDVPTRIRLQYDVSAETGEVKAQRAQERQNYYMQLLGSGVGDPRKIMEAWGRAIGERDPVRLFFDEQPMLPGAELQGQGGTPAAIPGDTQQGGGMGMQQQGQQYPRMAQRMGA